METKMLTAHIPLPLAEKLDELATVLGQPRDAIIAQAISEWVAREEARPLAILRMLVQADALLVVEQHRVADWADSLCADRKLA